MSNKKMKQVLSILIFLSLFGCTKCQQSGNMGLLVHRDTVVFSGKMVDFIGDSFTAGSGATDTFHRFSNLFSVAKNSTQHNLGVSGQCLQNTTNCGLPIFNKTIIPTYSIGRSVLFISLGVNDIGINTSSTTPEGYKLTLDSVVDYAINTKNWPSYRIVLVTPFWYTGYSYYDQFTGCGHTTANAIRHESYVNAVRSVANTKHCTIADAFTAIKNNPLHGTFLSVDNLHPNNAGHQAICNFLITLTYYNE